MLDFTFYTDIRLYFFGDSKAHILDHNNDEELRLQSWFLFNYQFKDEIRNKYKSTKTCLADDDRNLSHLESNFGQMTNEFIRYDVQRNQMGKPVKVQGNGHVYRS